MNFRDLFSENVHQAYLFTVLLYFDVLWAQFSQNLKNLARKSEDAV